MVSENCYDLVPLINLKGNRILQNEWMAQIEEGIDDPNEIRNYHVSDSNNNANHFDFQERELSSVHIGSEQEEDDPDMSSF
jgi:hypothetical protein